MITALAVIRIFIYAAGAIEAVRRRQWIIWFGFVAFILANAVHVLGLTGDLLNYFRTIGAMAIVFGYIRKR